MVKIRLDTIASFVEEYDRVVDIGCDHAYIPIYLVKENKCRSVIASDINELALLGAKKNIEKEKLTKKIQVVLSDGLKNIDQNKIDTIIIAGMGSSTILHILKDIDKNNVKKLILQSNNDHYLLRKKVLQSGFYLAKEQVIYEKGHYYVIGMYLLGKKKLKTRELYYGIYNDKNKDYYRFLEKKLKKENHNIPYKYIKDKINLLYKIWLLKKYL